MCTLSYLPLPNNEFIFTSNRDEKAHRILAIEPSLYLHEGKQLLYPKDPQGNGSWIVASEHDGIACLLNGAASQHVSVPPYRLSRGMVLIHFFNYQVVTDFILEYNFDGIEPFTLVAIKEDAVHQIRWDGNMINHHILDKNMPHIWSSATLYSPLIIKNRAAFFKQYLQQVNPSNALDKMLGFHYFENANEAENNIILRAANGTETVSISQVKVDAKRVKFDYFDLKQSVYFTTQLERNIQSLME